MQWLRAAGVFLAALLLVGSLLLLGLHLSQPGPCGRGAVPCSGAAAGPKCIPQRSWCNGHRDCPNGEDEDSVGCADWSGSDSVLRTVLGALPSRRPPPARKVCKLAGVPRGCRCDETKVNCRGEGLLSVPADIRGPLTHLVLLNNSISALDNTTFASCTSLIMLHLGNNRLSHIPKGTFAGKKNLQKLLLMNNGLRLWTALPAELQELQQLQWLFLDNNLLQDGAWPLDQLDGLSALEWLSISKNNLRLASQEFPAMASLRELNMTRNKVARVEARTFSKLSKLTLLELNYNDISSIHPEAFSNLQFLKELRLAYNKVDSLPDHVFDSLESLTKLDLSGNSMHIPGHLFFRLQNLTSLGLQDIGVEDIDVGMFSVLPKLSTVYFKFYYYCSFVPHVPRCKPTNDGLPLNPLLSHQLDETSKTDGTIQFGVSSLEHLLHALPLRLTVWLVAGFTLAANMLVMSGRAALSDDNRVLSLVIRSLAAADLLMGVYLVVIATADEVMRGEYHSHAHAWMTSWVCTAAGVLSMLSSEVSVMTLVFMSLDRFLLIADPLGRNFMSYSSSAKAVAAIWLSGLLLALLPVAVHWRNSTRFYGANGMCFPLHIDDPYLAGWQYSAFIFLGVNGASLLLVALLYLGMFLSIERSRRATPLAVAEVDVAVRFAFIVLTDACCWAPIATMKVLALARVHISAALYAWVVVLLLPINSAINPVLYTLTIPKYRRALRAACCPAACLQRCGRAGLHSPRRQSADTESSRVSHSQRALTACGPCGPCGPCAAAPAEELQLTLAAGRGGRGAPPPPTCDCEGRLLMSTLCPPLPSKT